MSVTVVVAEEVVGLLVVGKPEVEGGAGGRLVLVPSFLKGVSPYNISYMITPNAHQSC